MASSAHNVASAFSEFDDAIALDRDQRKRAEARHQKLKKALIEADFAADTFLQGSFGRKTMRAPLKDVDMVVLLPEGFRSELLNPAGAARVHEYLKQPVRAAMRDVGVDVEFDADKRPGKALQVTMPDCDFTVDLVAAFDDPDGDVLIADRDDRTWEPSNPRVLRDRISARNKLSASTFVHQVRMVKEFKAQRPELEDVCGLVIESLTYTAVTRRMSHAEAVAATLRHAASAVLGPVFDPTGAEDLSVKWTSAERQRFSAVFTDASQRADEALRLQRAGDELAAIEAWRALLGELFPAAPRQSSAEFLHGMASGSVTSTGRASTTLAGNQPARPGRSWLSR